MNELEAQYQKCRAARKRAEKDETRARLALEKWRRTMAFERGQLLSFGHVHRECLVDKAHVTVPCPDQVQHSNPVVTAMRLCWVETTLSLAQKEFAVPGFACHVDRQGRLCLIEARPSLTAADHMTWAELGLSATHPLEVEDATIHPTVVLEFSSDECGQESASLAFWGVGLRIVCGPTSPKLLSDLRQDDLQTWVTFVDGLLHRQLSLNTK